MPPPLEHRLVLSLILVDGSDTVGCRTVEMTEGDAALVGRASRDPSKDMTSDDCNFNIPNSVVSRSHAQFTYQHGGHNYPHEYKLFVEDLGSSHGTFLNERHLAPHAITEVAYGDSIRFGTRVIRTDAEFPPPVYNIEFTEVEDEGSHHTTGRSYSMPSEVDIPDYPYESDGESAESVISINSDDSTKSVHDKNGESSAFSKSPIYIDSPQQEAQVLHSLPVQEPGYDRFASGPVSVAPALMTPRGPSQVWNEAIVGVSSQLPSTQPLSPEISLPDILSTVAEPETPMSSKTKMISLQEILNQDSWPTPETPTTHRKRKFDDFVSDLEAFMGPDDDYSDVEEDHEDAEKVDVYPQLEASNHPGTSTVITTPLAEEVSKIAQELKEPQEPTPAILQQAQSISVAEPPRKRQRLSNIAVGVGAFIAGSISTVAALATLPDNFFS